MKWSVFLLVLLLAITSAPLGARSTPVGVATSIGALSVDRTEIHGRADLAEGSLLQTTTVPGSIQMSTGADVLLGTRSEGTFYSDHILLDRGALRVSNFSGLTVNVRQLAIGSDEQGTRALVRLTRKTIEVASIGGAVNVLDGGMLTRVAAGTKMSFQQSGAGSDQNQTANTGAAPAPKSKVHSDGKTFLWIFGITAVAALAIGLTAAAQGKSPF